MMLLTASSFAATRGIPIKGGKYLEVLAQADILLLDKTGTVTIGEPQITDIVATAQMESSTLLQLAASAERYSEHPLAEAVRAKARELGLELLPTEQFEAIPGQGIRARINGSEFALGNARLIPAGPALPSTSSLVAQDAPVC